jgi:hypothetical protein
MRARSIAAMLLVSALTACNGSGASGSSTLPVASSNSPARAKASQIDVTVHVLIRGGRRLKRGHFVSPSTNGVLARVYAHDDPEHQHLLGSSETDVSSGSAACGGRTG